MIQQKRNLQRAIQLTFSGTSMKQAISLTFALVGASLWFANFSASADDIEFNRDIRPILSDRCFQCHGPDDKKREADLRLDLAETAKQDLGGYRAIADGKPEKSALIERIFSDEEDERMPPESSGKKLTAQEKRLLQEWIRQGAKFEKHWAFQQLNSPRPPPLKDSRWAKNEIDHFIVAKLSQRNASPSPQANREALVRRLYIDLLGILPSPADVKQFVSDDSPNAYEKLVDSLLQSKHFGERMGRHWLDLARYADSNGYANDGLRSIWPYRDWVINAINADMPFDQFTIEQLAGDLLPEPTESQKIATGFHRNTPHQTEGGSDPEQYRVERTKNRTDTTGAVWLGLTVGCAQCHSHKFDPISHEEYYQLYAFFNNADEPNLTLKPNSEVLGKVKTVQQQIASLKRDLEEEKKLKQKNNPEKAITWQPLRFERTQSLGGATLHQNDRHVVLASGKNPDQDTYVLELSSKNPIKSIQLETLTDSSLPQNGPGRASNGNFVLAELIVQANGKSAPIVGAWADHSQKGYDVTDAFDGNAKSGWAINVSKGKLNVNRTAVFTFKNPVSGRIVIRMLTYEQGSGYNIGKFRVSASKDTPATVGSLVKQIQTQLQNKQKELAALNRGLPKTMVMSERSKPRSSFVQLRGDFLDKGKAVRPGTLSVLHPLKNENANRLDLARWIVSPNNPLTPRVVANRIWQHLFGIGLVETENDFGYQGTLPTHPRLLDFLATDLVKNGWKMKRMYKQIVMSATYRQSSAYRSDIIKQDPKNKLLARQNRYRVEGEIVRDLALTASGLLSKKMGGPSVFPPIPPNVIGTSSANHRWPESKGEDRYRRGIYTAIYRANVYPMLSVFDGPDRDNPCTRRSLSNTPLQALTIANDKTFVEMARHFGKRIINENAPSRNEQQAEIVTRRIKWAFQTAFSRMPSDKEIQRLGAYHDVLKERYANDPKSAQILAEENNQELATWTAIARVLLNLDEFITRE